MEQLLYEAFLIAILILINGYLSGTEIAVVTARKSHIKHLAESGQLEEVAIVEIDLGLVRYRVGETDSRRELVTIP